MTAIIDYTGEQESAWQEYVARTPEATICHDIRWHPIIRQHLGHRPRYIMAVDGSEVQGLLPLFVVSTWWGVKYLISIPWLDYGGACADSVEVESKLVERAGEIARELGAQFLELRSVEAHTSHLARRTDKVTFLLDLSIGADDLFRKQFDAKLRNQIRKSEKSGLTSVVGGKELLADFYRVFSRNMRDLGTPVWSSGLFGAVLDVFGQSARLIVANDADGHTIAGALALTFKDRMYVPSASAYRSARRLCPNHAIYWRLISDACEQSLRYFDFGRSTWDSGTFLFKKQWVPNPTQLTWQYDLNLIDSVPAVNPGNSKYNLLIGIWKRLPLPLANLLGPRVIRNFP